MILSNGAAPSEADILRAMLEAQEESRRARAWTSDVLDSIADGLAIVADDWTITYINSRAAGLLGTVDTATAIAGRTLWQAFPCLAGTALEGRLRHAMADR
jgi:PAS domain-containing protein